MDEILKKLLESDLLSEETKVTLTEQFKTAVDSYLVEERAKLETEVNVRLTEEFVKAREELVESLNEKLDGLVKSEFDELHGDIEQYRDLEVELAEKLVEEKEQLAVRFGEEMDMLVDKLDLFLESRVDQEFDELKEDITEAKKLNLGRKIVEAFGAEYKKIFKDDSSKTERELAEALDKLADARKRIAETDKQRVAEARQNKLDELLAPLTGSTREQMKLILNNVSSTEKLEEAYKVYLSRILKESTVAAPVTAKPAVTPLTESKAVTGNESEILPVAEATTEPHTAWLSRQKKLAGMVA